MWQFSTFAAFCISLLTASLCLVAAHAAESQEMAARLEQLKHKARYTEAIELAKQHIETLKNDGKAESPEVGRMLNRLAEFSLLTGQINQALEIYRQVLTNFSNLKGEQRQIVRTALGNLTLLYMSLGQFDSAEKYAELMEREIASAANHSDITAEAENTAPQHQNTALKTDIEAQNSETHLSGSNTVTEQPPSPSAVENSATNANRVGQAGRSVAERATASEKIGEDGVADRSETSQPSTSETTTRSAVLATPDKTPNDTENCPKPEVSATVTNGGVLDIGIVSECLAERFYHISYGEYRFRYQLSSTGEDAQRLDLFAGTQKSISIEFDGQVPILISVPELAFENTLKVALVWHKAVDLNLHVFEYAAQPGKPGHIWSGANRTFAETNRLVETEKRAHGYISQSSSGGQSETNIEVYTLIRYPGQRFGAVALALDFESRGFEARPPFCGSSELASVPFKVYRLEQDGNVQIESGLISSMPCGQSMEHKERYLSSAISDINLRQR